ncbi:hypothetical protein T484DRAFT_1782935 [Baffinella frigidus]|nr:hypothetical protein T484DRAFT_1782935 [Cryptophyta sp. CCMP2293]
MSKVDGTKAPDRKGRPPEKHFLYEIVNNIESGLDVDKLDYLQRDMDRALGRKDATFERLSLAARVCSVPANPAAQDSRDWKNLSLSQQPAGNFYTKRVGWAGSEP